MIEITKSAQEYFGRLIEQQEMDDIGLHLTVLKPGTPLASCDLQFHVPGQSGEKELEFEYDQFNLYVPASCEQWLEDAKIDFETTDAGAQLTIKAPGIKGAKPADSAELAEKIAWVLEAEINPGLAGHGGSHGSRPRRGLPALQRRGAVRHRPQRGARDPLARAPALLTRDRDPPARRGGPAGMNESTRNRESDK